MLTGPPSTWPQHHRDRWEEMAAVREYDGGLPREEAERLAAEEYRARMAGDLDYVREMHKGRR